MEKEVYKEDFYDEIFNEAMNEVFKHQQEIDNKNKQVIKEVKKLINYPFSRIKEALEYCDWKDQGYVEVEKTDYKDNNYPNHEFYRIIGNYTYFMKQDETKKFHYLVWQTSSYEDSYHGYILFPLTNGKYWKVSYSC